MGFFKAGNMIDGYSKLKMGMPKEEVIKILGNPNGHKMINGVETMIWSNTEFKGWMRGGSIERRIEVNFQNEKVVGFDGQNMSASRW